MHACASTAVDFGFQILFEKGEQSSILFSKPYHWKLGSGGFHPEKISSTSENTPSQDRNVTNGRGERFW